MLPLYRHSQCNSHVARLFCGLIRLLLVGLCLALPPLAALAQTVPQTLDLSLEKFAEGFAEPIDIANAGDDRLFIVERKGYIYVVQANGNKVTPAFLDIIDRVGSTGDEQGLLSIAFEPKDPTTFYVNYTNKQGDTTIARYKVQSGNPNQADRNSEQVLLLLDQPEPNHNGGDLAFGPDGELYIPLGDGGRAGDPNGFAQNLSHPLGKTLRIHVTGEATYTIPADNPFANDNDPNTLAEIWSYGWRNPWRFSFDRITGDMYLGDVGQRAREEVNFEPANTPGRNYGWNKCEGIYTYPGSNPPTPCPTAANNFVAPFYDYSHNDGCAVVGGYVYRGVKYPALGAVYLFADYCNGHFWSTVTDGQGGGQTTKLGKLAADNPSAFGEDSRGELYVADYSSGIIYHIKENSPTPTFPPVNYLPFVRRSR